MYSDKETGDLLVAWTNSYTERENEVFAVANDPVDALLYPEVGLYAYYGNHTNFGVNVLLEYPNPLQPDQYPGFSSGELYIGGELFLHFTKVCDVISVICYRNQNSIIKTNNLFDEALTEVGYLGSWARFGPWLPWMEMGLTSGGCLYNAPFFKLNSVEDLPETLYQWTVDNYPSFLQSPRNYSTPNLTSWRYFKNIIDKRRQDGEEDIQVPEQPDKSAEKTAYLDGDLMDHLGELGWIRASFQGSRYYVFGELTRSSTYFKLNLFSCWMIFIEHFLCCW